MKIRLNNLATAALLFALAPMAAIADPILGPTGHFYDVVLVPAGTTWDTANAEAEGPNHIFNGVQGHLATITSAEEDAFLLDLLRQNAGVGQSWVGGFQAPDSTEPGGGWKWVNDEGTFPGVDSDEPDYANWAAGEPNNTSPGEDHLAIGRFEDDDGWNDEGAALDLIVAFMVEFSGTVDATLCVTGRLVVCNPSSVQSVQLSVQPPSNSTLSQGLMNPRLPIQELDPFCPGVFAMRDRRVDVDSNGVPIGINDTAPLDVFFEFPGLGGTLGDLMLKDVYGSPCFAVVKGSAENFVLVNGAVVESEQFPEDVPGIGNTFSCSNNDPQRQAQSSYQTTVKFDMEEEAAAAMTKSCSSPSRQSQFGFSYAVINGSESCNIRYAEEQFESVRLAVLQCFTGKAVAKFDLLEQVIFRAQPSVDSSTWKKIHAKFNQARSMISTLNYLKGDTRLKELLGLVQGAGWINDAENDAGNIIMRTNNLIYRNAQVAKLAGNPLP